MFLQDINVKNKTVVLRVDYNVPILDNKVLDDTKIKASLKTIRYLQNNNCKIILLSHLGKIKEKEDMNKNSLQIIVPILEKLLDQKIYFSKANKEEILNKVKNLNYKDILLIENTRFFDYPDKLESNNNQELAKFYASLGDVFVNDAFATTHRLHASNYGISTYLKTAIGFLIQSEIKGLDIILNCKEKPFSIIMGGKKADDKIPVIKNLIDKCDYLLLSGGIANNFLSVLKYNTGLSEINPSLREDILNIYNNHKEKIILPEDVYVLNNDNVYQRSVSDIKSDDIIYDIGDKTINKFKDKINNSKTIFVNGTCGKYEDERFSKGTKEVFLSLKNSQVKVVVGGGDSVSAVNKFGLANDLYYISTGGGATLEYLSLGYLKALRKEEKNE